MIPIWIIELFYYLCTKKNKRVSGIWHLCAWMHTEKEIFRSHRFDRDTHQIILKTEITSLLMAGHYAW